jgi:hypothetical protein
VVSGFREIAGWREGPALPAMATGPGGDIGAELLSHIQVTDRNGQAEISGSVLMTMNTQRVAGL